MKQPIQFIIQRYRLAKAHLSKQKHDLHDNSLPLLSVALIALVLIVIMIFGNFYRTPDNMVANSHMMALALAILIVGGIIVTGTSVTRGLVLLCQLPCAMVSRKQYKVLSLVSAAAMIMSPATALVGYLAFILNPVPDSTLQQNLAGFTLDTPLTDIQQKQAASSRLLDTDSNVREYEFVITDKPMQTTHVMTVNDRISHVRIEIFTGGVDSGVMASSKQAAEADFTERKLTQALARANNLDEFTYWRPEAWKALSGELRSTPSGVERKGGQVNTWCDNTTCITLTKQGLHDQHPITGDILSRYYRTTLTLTLARDLKILKQASEYAEYVYDTSAITERADAIINAKGM